MEPPGRWPLPHRTDLRDRLVAAYSTGRGYHDLRHLAEVLDRLVELGAGEDTEVLLAAWYHDAVYDAGAADGAGNEERSAQLAEKELAGEPVDVAEVARLVRLTVDHRADPGDAAGAVLCDADLAILASEPERYREYTTGVRREYEALDDRTFAEGRAAVLRALLAKPALFHTAHARAAWEARARANIEAELATLATVSG